MRKAAADSLAAELKKIMPAKDAKTGAYADILKASRQKAQDGAVKNDRSYGEEIRAKYHKKHVAAH
jgi:hypothetical protein